MTADGKTYGNGKEEEGGNVGVTLDDTCGAAPLRGRTTFTLLTALTPQLATVAPSLHTAEQIRLSAAFVPHLHLLIIEVSRYISFSPVL